MMDVLQPIRSVCRTEPAALLVLLACRSNTYLSGGRLSRLAEGYHSARDCIFALDLRAVRANSKACGVFVALGESDRSGSVAATIESTVTPFPGRTYVYYARSGPGVYQTWRTSDPMASWSQWLWTFGLKCSRQWRLQ